MERLKKRQQKRVCCALLSGPRAARGYLGGSPHKIKYVRVQQRVRTLAGNGQSPYSIPQSGVPDTPVAMVILAAAASQPSTATTTGTFGAHGVNRTPSTAIGLRRSVEAVVEAQPLSSPAPSVGHEEHLLEDA